MLADSGDLTYGEQHCDTSDPKLKILPAPRVTQVGRLTVRYLGRNRRLQGLVVEIKTSSGTLTNFAVELLRGSHVVARASARSASTHFVRLVLHELGHRRGHLVPDGTYTLVVRKGGRTLFRRSVRVPH